MRYCITLEEVRRIAVYFDADNDEDAEEKAAQINQKTESTDFDDGTSERDYALCNTESGRTIIDWD